MPFAVFRRHQRKLLAVFAILAMFGFIVADSLPRLLQGNSAGGANPVVVDLYGKPVYRSDIAQLQAERNNANLFMAELTASLYGRPATQFFGDLNTRSLVDALVLQHEADRLGMPSGPDVGRDWLKQRAGAFMTRDRFERILAQYNNRISGEQLLADIGNQVRLSNVRMLLGSPVVTPLDVYQAYRDQNEKVSVKAVGFKVDDFLSKIPEPTASEIQVFYETYKDTLPDPNRPTPGFKVPRQVTLEILTLDGDALTRRIKDALPETDLRTYYENRKADFKDPSEFPEQIFAGDDKNELTPAKIRAFEEVRPYLANSLADERAQAEIIAKFNKVKEEHMIPFADKYLDAVDANDEAKKDGDTKAVNLPAPDSLKAVAEKEGLQHEITQKPLTREEAEHYGLISNAEVGLTRLSGGKKFADEFFDAKSTLFEPVELTDISGHRFLVRKLKDEAPRVPKLDEVRPQVILAWKAEKARPLAEKAAEALAATLKKDGGKITALTVDGNPVIETDPVTRLQAGVRLPPQFMETGPAVPTDIPALPNAGTALRDAYFGLTEGSVAVAPNEPKTVYYAMVLNKKVPATFERLYAPDGDFFRYRNEAINQAFKSFEDNWMNELRSQAGLKPDWAPSDEKETDKDRRAG